MRLTFFGMVTRGVLELSLEETYDALITNGWYKVFIDVTRSEITISPIELYTFMSMVRLKYHLDTSIAFLAFPDQMKTMRFFVTVAYNNRHMNVRVYPDRKTALDWLVKCLRYDHKTTRSDE